MIINHAVEHSLDQDGCPRLRVTVPLRDQPQLIQDFYYQLMRWATPPGETCECQGFRDNFHAVAGLSMTPEGEQFFIMVCPGPGAAPKPEDLPIKTYQKGTP